ncbi:MAG: reverse transcriptase domain-containing protein [Candidatus Thorarchaeota archaeon]|jgi:group II intron reverse transcriptase/maturase
MLPNEAQKYLEIVGKRGEADSTLKRVYYNIVTNEELYLQAYANLYANKGAMTPGTDPDNTVDGMSITRIRNLMETLKKREYRWPPVRRVYIEKKNSLRRRPLGMPGFNEKLIQEVLRMVLETYYEQLFRKSSHGFRPQLGCHTALDEIWTWHGVKWFVEGDIQGCFENINHSVLLNILGRKIKDQTLLSLIKGMLEAGYMEEWTYHKTYSGTPQGGIISPLLANIVLNELDVFVEDVLIPEYTTGKTRRYNQEYMKLARCERTARQKGDWVEAKKLRKRYTKLPSRDPNDPEYGRLKYVRYADDFIFGYTGTKQKAMEIKERTGRFLKGMKLELSEDKTFITHAMTEKTRFLSYHINRMQNDVRTQRGVNHPKTGSHKRRTYNQLVHMSVPLDVIKSWVSKVKSKNKIQHRTELMNASDYDIIMAYEIELQGLMNYYNRAYNQSALIYLRYVWEESLLKTLARKHKTGREKARRRYCKFQSEDGRRVIGVEVEREGKKPLTAMFGRKPIQRQEVVPIVDEVQTLFISRNELLNRLLAEKCELCGRTHVPLNGHHVKKLKDLKERWKGKPAKPTWVRKMIEKRRKTLFVCEECHRKIHAGTYDGRKIT